MISRNSLGLALVASLLSASLMAQSNSRGDGSGPSVPNVITAAEVEALFGGAQRGGAGIIRVNETAFQAGSGLITFSEVPTGETNPIYTAADYGGGAGDPTVTFAGFFDGQALGDASSCPAGAALSGCVVGTPTDPITLDAASPQTSVVNDFSNPTSPVLSGSPTFNGPIAIHFDGDVAGVGLEGGFFDAAGGTAITAFDRAGNTIGSVVNEETGIEFLGLVTASGTNDIAGLLFSLVGEETNGFAIDNLRFGDDSVVGPGPGPGPEPTTLRSVPLLDVWSLGLLSVVLMTLGVLVIRRIS